MRWWSVLPIVLAMSCGCARTIVKRDPGPNDTGIRFYRPRPYLLIAPAAAPADHGTDTQTVPVTIRLDYLPDYSEEYSIRVTPGLGQAELNATLENGWNLNSVQAKTDQRYAEIIGGVGSALAGVPVAHLDKQEMAILRAQSNVPLGYYEGVIGCNELSRKELLGWRYVGFMPFRGCPVKAGVCRDEILCQEGTMYALLFKGGVLCMETLANAKAEQCITVSGGRGAPAATSNGAIPGPALPDTP